MNRVAKISDRSTAHRSRWAAAASWNEKSDATARAVAAASRRPQMTIVSWSLYSLYINGSA